MDGGVMGLTDCTGAQAWLGCPAAYARNEVAGMVLARTEGPPLDDSYPPWWHTAVRMARAARAYRRKSERKSDG